MKQTYFSLLFFLLFGLSAQAQNFYVLQLKGTVFANNKKLKKKDKINIDSRLTFDDCEDAVRLIGPTGHYYIMGAQAEENENNELILELRNEILALSTFAHTAADQNLAVVEYEYPPFNYTTLIEGDLLFDAYTNTDYFIEYTSKDSIYQIPLPIKDEKVQLDTSLFAHSIDSSYTFFYTQQIENYSDTTYLFTLSPPKWLSSKPFVQELQQMAIDSSATGVYSLRYAARHYFYKKGEYIPDPILEYWIKEEVPWYLYQPYQVYETVFNPMNLSLELYLYGSNDVPGLVQIYKDTLLYKALPIQNHPITLREKDFKPLLKNKSPLYHVLIYTKADAQTLKEATPIYYFKPEHFLSSKKLEKEIKFIRKINPDLEDYEIVSILEEMLEEEWGIEGNSNYIYAALEQLVINFGKK